MRSDFHQIESRWHSGDRDVAYLRQRISGQCNPHEYPQARQLEPFRASGLGQGTTVCSHQEGQVRDSVFLVNYASADTRQEESHCDPYPESRENRVTAPGRCASNQC